MVSLVKNRGIIIKLLTRNTDYAVRAVSYIYRHGDRVVSVSELVKELDVHRPFLRKILQILNKEGIVRSYKGIGGGFKLSRPADQIFLVELIRIFQGPLKLNECMFKKKICPNRGICPLKRKIDAIEEGVISELKSISIKDITDGGA